MTQIDVSRLFEQSSGNESAFGNPVARYKATGLRSGFTDCYFVPSGSSEKAGTSDH